MSAFTQRELMEGSAINPPKDTTGSWIGSKNAMSGLAVKLTTQGTRHALHRLFPLILLAQAARSSL